MMVSCMLCIARISAQRESFIEHTRLAGHSTASVLCYHCICHAVLKPYCPTKFGAHVCVIAQADMPEAVLRHVDQQLLAFAAVTIAILAIFIKMSASGSYGSPRKYTQDARRPNGFRNPAFVAFSAESPKRFPSGSPYNLDPCSPKP